MYQSEKDCTAGDDGSESSNQRDDRAANYGGHGDYGDENDIQEQKRLAKKWCLAPLVLQASANSSDRPPTR